MKDEIENDSNGNDDIDLIVQKIFGPLGMIIVIMVIIGVCIVLHNKKYQKINRNSKIKILIFNVQNPGRRAEPN